MVELCRPDRLARSRLAGKQILLVNVRQLCIWMVAQHVWFFLIASRPNSLKHSSVVFVLLCHAFDLWVTTHYASCPGLWNCYCFIDSWSWPKPNFDYVTVAIFSHRLKSTLCFYKSWLNLGISGQRQATSLLSCWPAVPAQESTGSMMGYGPVLFHLTAIPLIQPGFWACLECILYKTPNVGNEFWQMANSPNPSGASIHPTLRRWTDECSLTSSLI